NSHAVLFHCINLWRTRREGTGLRLASTSLRRTRSPASIPTRRPIYGSPPLRRPFQCSGEQIQVPAVDLSDSKVCDQLTGQFFGSWDADLSAFVTPHLRLGLN